MKSSMIALCRVIVEVKIPYQDSFRKIASFANNQKFASLLNYGLRETKKAPKILNLNKRRKHAHTHTGTKKTILIYVIIPKPKN